MNALAPLPGARQPASDAACPGPAGFRVRLPVLRRPPGWAVLDETALRARAVQLLHAEVAPVPVMREFVPAQAPQPAPRHAVAPPHLAAGLEALDGMPTAPDPAGTAAAVQARPHRERPHRQPVGLGLMAMMVVIGLMALAPWLIWAPLVGGLALGILLLQTGLLRRWLAVRRQAEGLADPAPGVGAGQVPPTLQSVQAVEAVKGVKVPALRFAHAGWLLTAVLVLVGVQAAMLITTIQVQRAAAPKPALREQPGTQRRVAEDQAAPERLFGPTLQRPLTPATPGEPAREAPPANDQRVVR